MKIHVILILWLSTLLMAERIHVAVAANVSYAMDALQHAFYTEHPHIDIRVVLGSTGKLTAQIQHGAPYDIFMAANMRYPQRLHALGLSVEAPQVYAKGSLSYFTTQEHNITEGMALLARKEIRTIAIANPKTAPYGAASMQALRSAHIYNAVKHKLVFGESIAQTLAYVLHAADIGLIATSARYSPKMKLFRHGLYWSEVDPALYTPIEQGIVLLKRAENSQAAHDFYAFMLSKKAQNILKKFGYAVP